MAKRGARVTLSCADTGQKRVRDGPQSARAQGAIAVGDHVRSGPRASGVSFRLRGGRDRGSVIHADAPEARELYGGMAQIESCDQAQNVLLDALDPGELHA